MANDINGWTIKTMMDFSEGDDDGGGGIWLTLWHGDTVTMKWRSIQKCSLWQFGHSVPEKSLKGEKKGEKAKECFERTKLIMQSKIQPHHWESMTLAETGEGGLSNETSYCVQVEHFGEMKVKLKNWVVVGNKAGCRPGVEIPAWCHFPTLHDNRHPSDAVFFTQIYDDGDHIVLTFKYTLDRVVRKWWRWCWWG